MEKNTPFYDLHLKANAKMVDFAGWQMPLHYGSQIEEHHHVRRDAGVFDVSHMGIIDLHGSDTTSLLGNLLANNVYHMPAGKALYTCMLNERGGVIDDLIVYKIADDFYRLVVNAATRDKDIRWITNHLVQYDTTLVERRDLAMLAISGPQIIDKIAHIFSVSEAQVIAQLKPFTFTQMNEEFIARTGYTGEEGFELIFPTSKAAQYWQAILAAGIVPCGLGARDTLRLEAGLNLYGTDMDEQVTPLESNLAWTVAFEPKERQFIGREALEQKMAEGIKKRLVGLVLLGPGVMRNHQKVYVSGQEGEVTSGGFSPTLGVSIALARVPNEAAGECLVAIRNKNIPAQMVKPPFVRHGKKMV